MNKMTESKRKQFMANERLKCLERVRKFRAKAKLVNQESEKTNSGDVDVPSTVAVVQQKQHFTQHERTFYNTDGALAKAHTKFRKGLPNSPGKQRDVILKFFNSLPKELRKEITTNKTNVNKGGRKGIGPQLCNLIAQFYERDDVSRMSANTKDARYYRDPATREKQMKQKRYMIITLEQAYDKFLITNAGKRLDVLFCEHQTKIFRQLFCR